MRNMIAIAGLFATSVLCSDPGQSQYPNILSSIANLNVSPLDWSIKDGIIIPTDARRQGDNFILVKKEYIKSPTWYNLSCVIHFKSLDRFSGSNGLVFGYKSLDDFWTLRFLHYRGETSLLLAHVLGHKKSKHAYTEIRIPVVLKSNASSIRIQAEIFDHNYIKLTSDGQLLAEYSNKDITSSGLIGLYQGGSDTGISQFSLAEISKR